MGPNAVFEHPTGDIVGSDLSYKLRFDLNIGYRFFAPHVNYSSYLLCFLFLTINIFLSRISARMLRLVYSFIAFKDKLQRYTISGFSFKCTPLNQGAAIHQAGDTSRVELTPTSVVQNNQNTTLT